LRFASRVEAGTCNALGDKQLLADLQANEIIIAALRNCNSIALVSSEEDPRDILLGGSGYSVAFDPLDGSRYMHIFYFACYTAAAMRAVLLGPQPQRCNGDP
jgi:fructose-1,6-bisphosphatase